MDHIKVGTPNKKQSITSFSMHGLSKLEKETLKQLVSEFKNKDIKHNPSLLMSEPLKDRNKS